MAGSRDPRFKLYKNVGQSVEEGRRKREEDGLQLRKQKREEQLSKKRNIYVGDEVSDVSSFLKDATPTSLKPHLLSEVLEEQRAALVKLRQLLSADDSHELIDETLQLQCLPKIVELLSSSDKDLQFEVAWIVTNIASGTSDHTKAVVKEGVIPPLVQLLHSPHPLVRDQALWALGNISGDGPQLRRVVLNAGIFQPLMGILKVQKEVNLVSAAVWVLSHLCKGCSAGDEVMQCVPVVSKLVYVDEVPLLVDTLWCLVYLADGTNDKIQCVIESGVCRRLVQLLLSTSSDVVIPALRAVGNILTGSDMQAQVIINCSVLPALQGILKSSSDNIVIKNTCWCLSNISAGNRVQIQAVMDCQLFPQLMDVMVGTADYKTRKEAAWAVLNATAGGTDEQIRHLVALGCVGPICSMLSVPDTKVIAVTLEGLENILKVGARSLPADGVNPFAKIIEEAYGLEKIESLQMHNSDEIGSHAAHLIELYFSSGYLPP